jgi:phage baseplate assembly protein W
MQKNVPVGINIPYTRGNNGYFEQTYSDITRAHTNLKMLLLTAKGERPLMPTYGSDLRFLLFNPGDDQHDSLFQDAVIESTEMWMPEVVIYNVSVERNFDNFPNKAILDVEFSITSIPDSNEILTLEVYQ